MTVLADLILLGSKLKAVAGIAAKLVDMAKTSWNFISGILSGLRSAKAAIEKVSESVPEIQKVGLFTKIKQMITPRAKLTYWLADEEVVVYVSDFQQKDKFKLVYKELETGRVVMVNSADSINYRLEELKSTDQIEKTHIEQNQRY